MTTYLLIGLVFALGMSQIHEGSPLKWLIVTVTWPLGLACAIWDVLNALKDK